MHRRLASLFILSAACSFLAGGCGPKEETQTGGQSGNGQQGGIQIQFARNGAKIPASYTWEMTFKGELTSPTEYNLVDRQSLEFIPIVRGPGSARASIEVYIDDGGGQKLLESVTPFIALNRDEIGASNLKELFSSWVKIDLDDFAGKTVRISFRLIDPAQGVIGSIANLRVYRRNAEKAPPHILMICSDTHRYDRSIGGEGPKLMPNLTELAARSVVYHKAYSNASWTLPSITSTFTDVGPTGT